MSTWWGVMACAEDVDRSVNMYGKIFHAEPERIWEDFWRFNFGNGRFYVMKAPRNAPLLVLEVDDVAGEVARLRDIGCQVQDPFDIPVGQFAFFQDLEGHDFALIQNDAQAA